MPVLTDEQASQLAMMSGLLSDEGAKKRVEDMLSAKAAIDDAREKLAKENQVNSANLRAAEARLQTALQKEAQNAAWKAALDQREQAMAEVRDGMNAERKEWEHERDKVAAQQNETRADLEHRSDLLYAKEQAMAKEAADLARDADAVEALRKRYQAMVDDFKAVIERHEVDAQ
jgi:hypothetical protein